MSPKKRPYADGRDVESGWFDKQFWIWGDRVFWDRYEIRGADAASFGYYNSLWAADDARIYCHNHEIRNADYDSFEVLNAIFARDRRYVHHIRGVAKGCDANSFEVLDAGDSPQYVSPCGYARDRKGVYFHEVVIGGPRRLRSVNARAFRVIKYGFATDEQRVFSYGKTIHGADPMTFRVLSAGYSRDANNVFYGHELIPGVNLKKFKVVGGHWGQDDKRIYTGEVVEQGLAPSSFDLAAYVKLCQASVADD